MQTFALETLKSMFIFHLDYNFLKEKNNAKITNSK